MDTLKQGCMYVTNSLTGDMIEKPFLLPGSIWQLKCFVARQHYDTKFNDIDHAVQLLKVSKSASDRNVMVCTDWNESVDAIDFKYMFILSAEKISAEAMFKPWRDMISVERLWSRDSSHGFSFEWYKQAKEVVEKMSGSMPFDTFAFTHYAHSEQAKRHGLKGRFERSSHLENLKQKSRCGRGIVKNAIEGSIKNARELLLLSFPDERGVEILVFEDDHNYHLFIHAYGEYQNLIQGEYSPSHRKLHFLLVKGTLKPFRDMVPLEIEKKHGCSYEWYMQEKDRVEAILGSLPFEAYIFAYYAKSEQSKEHRLRSRVVKPSQRSVGRLEDLKQKSKAGEGIIKNAIQGNIRNANELWLLSGRDQVVEILVFEDSRNYHLFIHAIGDWQDVLRSYH